ncbi:MAG: hypothetical protein A2W98_01635 [Bacteroidetes bacterium GWF2_33_38]|nr:MAG: hypothetical protein A2W98_01635 [Bacteroidetes bacterium GWF2_33_38]OFY72596.1 MAG: hypothetical protein A2265_01005 [Bacteroidetes bacterium RIFOXYA12_FULL_33_9]OFY85855.1 MAG: hypothetical protein A2236_03565 [Bacteroidetes bacterium RIFOXYA2_FULL_33_7]
MLISTLGFSQIEIATLSTSQAKKFAQSAIRVGNIEFAIQCLEHYLTHKPEDSRYAYVLAGLYRELRLYTDAMKWYKYSYEINPRKNLKSLYYYALMLKMDGNYDLAEEFFEKFKKEGKKSDFYKKIRKQYQAQILGIDLASDQTHTTEISRFGETINQNYSEYSPVFVNDTTILYSAFNDDGNDSLQTVFYEATLNENIWTKERAFNEIAKRGDNVGNGCFSPDKKRFYFTKCSENWQNKIICEIYVSVNKNGIWNEPVKLGNKINLANFTSTHPCVGKNSKNADIIYFVSDRPDGQGEKDIWYAEYNIKTNLFYEPVNAGRKINTEYDEITPFVDTENNILFFSSDGHPGLGGLDVFSSCGSKRKWSEPENLKAPINSSSDDLYYSYNDNSMSGLLVSNREDLATGKIGTCCDDIYSFKIISPTTIDLRGNVYFADANNYASYFKENSMLSKINVSLFYVDGEELIYVKTDTTDIEGYFSFHVDVNKKYKLVVDDYQSDEFEVFSATQDTTLTASIGLYGTPVSPMILEDIFYEFDDINLTANAQNAIKDKLLPFLLENPEVRIEILSHTDNHGAEEYNEILSQKRAEAVVDFLVDMGISYNRLIAIGYGESNPIAFNINPDGSDNENGRKLNRRTELKIITDTDMSFFAENAEK